MAIIFAELGQFPAAKYRETTRYKYDKRDRDFIIIFQMDAFRKARDGDRATRGEHKELAKPKHSEMKNSNKTTSNFNFSLKSRRAIV